MGCGGSKTPPKSHISPAEEKITANNSKLTAAANSDPQSVVLSSPSSRGGLSSETGLSSSKESKTSRRSRESVEGRDGPKAIVAESNGVPKAVVDKIPSDLDSDKERGEKGGAGHERERGEKKKKRKKRKSRSDPKGAAYRAPSNLDAEELAENLLEQEQSEFPLGQPVVFGGKADSSRAISGFGEHQKKESTAGTNATTAMSTTAGTFTSPSGRHPDDDDDDDGDPMISI